MTTNLLNTKLIELEDGIVDVLQDTRYKRIKNQYETQCFFNSFFIISILFMV